MTAMKVVLLSTWVCFAFVHSSGATCGGTFTATSGTITSPGFPNNYTNNANCIYIITAPANQRITLNFTHFDLEAPSSSNGGCFDYVEVRDGNSAFSPRLGLVCNNTLPAMRRSFGHQMWIKFFTDDSVVRTGFNATYTTGTYDKSFFLITSSSGSIFRMDVETRTNYNLKMILRNPIAVDFDPVEQRIYWSEVGTTNNWIASASPTGSNIRFVKNAGIGAVIDGLAVDPFSRLLFYTDAGNDVIAMMNLSTFSHKTIINSSLDQPRAIVLHVTDGVMFWTDWGGPAKIERANYDGSDRRTLVSFYLLYVNALALDVANSRLYWADAGTDHVESVNLDGGDRSSPPIFQAQPTRHFFGMALLRNVLYITDWGPDGPQSTFSIIIRQPLGADQNNRTVYGSIGQRMNDIHAYDQDWASSGPNGCGNNNGGCSSFCIPLPGNNSKCLCPDEESLLADNTTCVNASSITTQTTTTPTTPTTTTTTPETTTTTPTTTTTTPTTTTTTTQQTTSSGTPGETDLIPIIVGAVGGVVVIVLIIVIIVVIVKRNKPIYEKPPKGRKRGAKVQEEHPYSDLAVINIAFDTEDTEDCRNSTYAEIGDLPIPDHADVHSLPDRPTTLAPPAPCSVKQAPPPADDYLTPTTRPAHSYHVSTVNPPPTFPKSSAHLGQSCPPPSLPKPDHSASDDYATFINPN